MAIRFKVERKWLETVLSGNAAKVALTLGMAAGLRDRLKKAVEAADAAGRRGDFVACEARATLESMEDSIQTARENLSVSEAIDGRLEAEGSTVTITSEDLTWIQDARAAAHQNLAAVKRYEATIEQIEEDLAAPVDTAEKVTAKPLLRADVPAETPQAPIPAFPPPVSEE